MIILAKIVFTLSFYLHSFFNKLNVKGFIYLVLDKTVLLLIIIITFLKKKVIDSMNNFNRINKRLMALKFNHLNLLQKLC